MLTTGYEDYNMKNHFKDRAKDWGKKPHKIFGVFLLTARH